MATQVAPLLVTADFADGVEVFELLLLRSQAPDDGTDVIVTTNADVPVEQAIGIAMLTTHSIIETFKRKGQVGREFDALLALMMRQMAMINDKLAAYYKEDSAGEPLQ